MQPLYMFDFGRLGKQRMQIVAKDGITLPVVLVNAETGAVVREGQITFDASVELHFAASNKTLFEGLWYLQKRDREGVWHCTCLECRDGWCPHLLPFTPEVVA